MTLFFTYFIKFNIKKTSVVMHESLTLYNIYWLCMFLIMIHFFIQSFALITYLPVKQCLIQAIFQQPLKVVPLCLKPQHQYKLYLFKGKAKSKFKSNIQACEMDTIWSQDSSLPFNKQITIDLEYVVFFKSVHDTFYLMVVTEYVFPLIFITSDLK